MADVGDVPGRGPVRQPDEGREGLGREVAPLGNGNVVERIYALTQLARP